MIVPSYGVVTGEWGLGRATVFLVGNHPLNLELSNVEELTNFTWEIRKALTSSGITGANGAEIDHIELFGRPHDASGSSVATSCSARVKPTIDRPAEPERAPRWHASLPTANWPKVKIWKQEEILGAVFEGRAWL